MIDADLKLKLAKAARELANELEAGTAPKLGVGMHYNRDGTPCCAMGHVYAKAGVGRVAHPEIEYYFVPGPLPSEAVLVAHGVESANDALAPWLWLADKTASTRTPLPQALRDYAFAVEGL